MNKPLAVFVLCGLWALSARAEELAYVRYDVATRQVIDYATGPFTTPAPAGQQDTAVVAQAVPEPRVMRLTADGLGLEPDPRVIAERQQAADRVAAQVAERRKNPKTLTLEQRVDRLERLLELD